MLRVAEGLRAVSSTIDEIESRIAGPAGGVLGAGGVSGFNLIDVAKVFSQGVEFASAAGRQRLVDKLALEVAPPVSATPLGASNKGLGGFIAGGRRCADATQGALLGG